MQKADGKILKGIGGFYYIETEYGLIECKARGIFRNKDMTPYVGDRVSIEFNTENNKGIVNEIFSRKNFLVRPAVSNIDRLYIVCSAKLPEPNFLNIDKLTAMAVHSEIEPIIIVSKTDLDREIADLLVKTYTDSGIKVFETSIDSNENIDEIRETLWGKTSVFTGNSGVGKSTFINRLFPELSLKTGEISEKLSRGKHTTRHVELFKLSKGGYIADTPGFSSIDFEANEIIRKDEVLSCFPDILEFDGECRFPDCRHIGEKDCKIKEAVEEGKIVKTRYLSYCELYKQAEKINEWEINSKRGKR